MIRKFEKEDAEKLKRIVESIETFSTLEKETAIEMIHAATMEGKKFYDIFVFEKDGEILGYHCTGKRALSDGAYDLYWIVVAPEHQDNSVGRLLLEHVEDYVKERNGRWILIETSSKEELLPTRKFYLRNNYTIISEIKDFYSEGEHLILFGKFLKK